MNLTYIPLKLADVPDLTQGYVNQLSAPIDSFLEDHILAAQAYLIHASGRPAGLCAVFERELLTLFYLEERYIPAGQEILRAVRLAFSLNRAFVPTCDELFLSLALDQMSHLEKQAYFFQERGAGAPPPPLYPDAVFRPAAAADEPAIKKISGDFFDRLATRIDREEMFVLTTKEEDTLLGVGIIEKGRLLTGYASIGMFTGEPFRRQGVGRTIIYRLRQVCHQRGLIPIAGCWYFNENSKRTLESAGMMTRTRLLHIHFPPAEPAPVKGAK